MQEIMPHVDEQCHWWSSDVPPSVDAVVIGGGIVGTAIAERLARHDAEVLLVEREPDVGEGASKANSGIVHTGFDARPGTLEARLLQVARELWPETARDLAIPLVPCGAVMVAKDEAEARAVQTSILERARAQGVAVQVLTRDELLSVAPFVTESAVGGLHIPGEAVVDPFWATRAFAEAAVREGARVSLGTAVEGMEIAASGRRVRIRLFGGAVVEAGLVVNAAGLWADEVAALIGDRSFQLRPRKGQFLLSEDDLGVDRIVLPVPGESSKGILVTPLAIGGLLLGPTAEDVDDKRDVATTAEGLERVRRQAAALVPSVAKAASIRQFAGLRAVHESGDYLIRPASTTPRVLHVAGIRSTGISTAPAIAWYVAQWFRQAGLLGPERSRSATAPEGTLENQNMAGGEVVCICRNVTRGEILRALHGPLPARTVDAVKRRTGAMLGECQGNECLADILEIMATRFGVPPWRFCKHASGSFVCLPGGDHEHGTV